MTILVHMVQDAAVYDLVGTDVKLNVFKVFHFDPLTSLQFLLLHGYLRLADIAHLQEARKVEICRLMSEACRNLTHPKNSFKIRLDASFFKDFTNGGLFQWLVPVNEATWKLPLRRFVSEPKLLFDQ